MRGAGVGVPIRVDAWAGVPMYTVCGICAYIGMHNKHIQLFVHLLHIHTSHPPPPSTKGKKNTPPIPTYPWCRRAKTHTPIPTYRWCPRACPSPASPPGTSAPCPRSPPPSRPRPFYFCGGWGWMMGDAYLDVRPQRPSPPHRKTNTN